MNAANKQTKALASPTAQLQGMISGLSGVAGACIRCSGRNRIVRWREREASKDNAQSAVAYVYHHRIAANSADPQ